MFLILIKARYTYRVWCHIVYSQFVYSQFVDSQYVYNS